VIRDISRVHHLEKVRSDFVANVSHELKTPITSIKGFIETLSSDSFSHDEKTHEYLAIVRQQSERLQFIVDDLLTLSRLERKEGYIMKKTASIYEVILTAISLCQLNAKKQNIYIQTECDEKLSGFINANLIEQALVNLLSNAIKYSDPDTTIVVRAHEKESSIHIEVADQGFGIEARHHDRLFERFYRIDAGRSRHMGGTGLGLSIVKHIIQNHKGTIQLDSVPGKGSTFTIMLPNAETED
jgi:two-component system phosphate regulon sensor histidine kinase PhoR